MLRSLLLICIIATAVLTPANAGARSSDPTIGLLNSTDPDNATRELLEKLNIPEPDRGGLIKDPNPFSPEPLYESLCQKALAAVSCKSEYDFNIVSKKGQRAFKFNTFYGSGSSNFFCVVSNEFVRLSGTPWGSIRISLPYRIDIDRRCIVAKVGKTMCGTQAVIRSCEGNH